MMEVSIGIFHPMMEQKTAMPSLYDHESANAPFYVPALDVVAFNVTLINDDAATRENLGSADLD
jgi:hypothetical protein